MQDVTRNIGSITTLDNDDKFAVICPGILQSEVLIFTPETKKSVFSMSMPGFMSKLFYLPKSAPNNLTLLLALCKGKKYKYLVLLNVGSGKVQPQSQSLETLSGQSRHINKNIESVNNFPEALQASTIAFRSIFGYYEKQQETKAPPTVSLHAPTLSKQYDEFNLNDVASLALPPVEYCYESFYSSLFMNKV